MKSSRLPLCCILLAGTCWLQPPLLHAQNPDAEAFPGVKAVLTPEQYAAAGLSKLSPEEQARLNEALQGYFAGASQKVAERAASTAVDRAVKEKRVQPPTFIDSHITGRFTGWGPRTVFVLDNGQRWKPNSSNPNASFPAVDNPQVFIVRDMFGYKMAILGGTTLRVSRL